MAKPASKPNWTYNNPDFATRSVEPTAQKKTMGFNVGERPASEFFNWLLWIISQWIDHFDETIGQTSATSTIYSAILGGASATHADINAIMADADLANQDLRILLAGPLVFAQTQIINRDGIEILGVPGATISKGGGTAIGIQIESSRVKIKDVRFLNWDEVGGEAINLTATSKNCVISDNSFHTVSKDINNLGANNVIVNNVLEID